MKKDYLNYVNESLKHTVYSDSKEKEIIGIILGDTEAYKNLRNEVDSNDFEYLPVKWVSKSDEELAFFILHMFAKTKQVNINQLSLEQFRETWDKYTKDPWFFIQAVNYMRNSDDYVFGDRYHFVEEEPYIQFREGNHGTNMVHLFEEFKINASAKKMYYSKIIALGEALHRLLIE